MARGADITARPIDLGSLLDGIEAGSVVLPDFQRDFEWSETEVASLVATIMAGWPAGSLLLMRGKPAFFETREFEGAKARRSVVEYVVLDGQQRLTALFHALRGTGDLVYAIDLDRLKEGEASAERIEEAFVIHKRDEWEQMPALGSDRLLVPLYALTSATDFFEWRDEAAGSVEPEIRADVLRRLSRAYKDFLGTVNHYQFPAVVLESDLPTEAVVRIFERINRGGLQLSAFDLLVARAYTPDWNLRVEWDRARREAALLEVYMGDDGLPVAQAISLREKGDIRRPALLDLSGEAIRGGWDDAVRNSDAALEFIARSGMRHPQWVPYRTLVIPLAALAAEHNLEAARDVLEPWLWARSLEAEYDVASSTKVAADFDALRNALSGGDPLDLEVDLGRLWGATKRQQSALWRTFLSLLLRSGAQDPWTGDALVDSPLAAAEVSVPSLFARSANGAAAPAHLWVLSHVLVHRGRRGLGRRRTVLAELADAASQDASVAQNLRTQFIEPEALTSNVGDPEEVMRLRLSTLTDYLRQELPSLKITGYPLGSSSS